MLNLNTNIQTTINHYKTKIKTTIDSLKEIKDLETFKSILNDTFKTNNNTYSNVFINSEDVDLSHIDEPVNIILSPLFYWVKIESLPVKSIKKANKIAPSYFSGHIPDGEHKYFTIKHDGDNRFVLFAFDENEIINTLINSNIKLSLIRKIYFTQSECDMNHTHIIELDDSSYLAKKDDVYVILPKSLVNTNDENIDTISQTLSHISLSSNNIPININSSFLSEKQLNLITLSLSVIIISLASQYFILKSSYKNLSISQILIMKKYKIPASALQLKSIKNSLLKKKKFEIKTKNNIQNLFDLPLVKGDFFRDISINQRTWSIRVIMQNDDNVEKYKEYLLDKFFIGSIEVKDNEKNTILMVRGKIENK